MFTLLALFGGLWAGSFRPNHFRPGRPVHGTVLCSGVDSAHKSIPSIGTQLDLIGVDGLRFGVHLGTLAQRGQIRTRSPLPLS